MFKYILYKFGQFLVRRLSLKSAYRLGMFFSRMQCILSPRDRRAVKNNLCMLAVGPAAIRRSVIAVFENFGKYLVEFFRMTDEVNHQFIVQKVRIENEEYLKQAKARGKGIIFLTAHLGNWEMGAAILSRLGYPVVAVALPHRERPVNELFNKQREHWGITVVPIKFAVHRCLTALRNNKYIALVADRDFTNNGEPMSFFGKEVLIPKGPALFALKTGATILPTFLTRGSQENFILHFSPMIVPPAQSRGVLDPVLIFDLVKQYTSVIEERIRIFPEQWLMFREFWDPRSNIVT